MKITLLLCCCGCHFYVYLVAHTHTKNISKTLQNHHASMQRLNSICGVGGRPSSCQSPGARFEKSFPSFFLQISFHRQDTLLVINGNTCLLYSERPAAVSKSNHLEVIPHHQSFQQSDERSGLEKIASRRNSFNAIRQVKLK